MNQPVNCQLQSLALKNSKCEMEDFLEYDVFTAASIGDLEFLESNIRLENVNDFNYGKWTAMMYASYYDHPNVVAFLLNIGGNPQAGNKTSLMLAASCGHENVLKVLLNLGKIKDNVQDSHGYIALHHAVSSGHYESSSILISFGSNQQGLPTRFGCAIPNFTEHICKSQSHGILNRIFCEKFRQIEEISRQLEWQHTFTNFKTLM